MTDRTIVVPEHCRAIIVTEALLRHYRDWTALPPNVEARAVYGDNLVVNLQARYTSPPDTWPQGHPMHDAIDAGVRAVTHPKPV